MLAHFHVIVLAQANALESWVILYFSSVSLHTPQRSVCAHLPSFLSQIQDLLTASTSRSVLLVIANYSPAACR